MHDQSTVPRVYFGDGPGQATIANSVIANNTGNACSMYPNVAPSTNLDIISSVLGPTGCTSSVETGGNLRLDDLVFDELEGSGHGRGLRPPVGSPLIDRGAGEWCTDATGMPLLGDQSGQERLRGEGCDVGALEAE